MILPVDELVDVPVYITDIDTGDALNGVHIIITSINNLETFECTTGLDGMCTLYDIPIGEYQYTIHKDNYSDETGIIEISTGSSIAESLNYG